MHPSAPKSDSASFLSHGRSSGSMHKLDSGKFLMSVSYEILKKSNRWLSSTSMTATFSKIDGLSLYNLLAFCIILIPVFWQLLASHNLVCEDKGWASYHCLCRFISESKSDSLAVKGWNLRLTAILAVNYQICFTVVQKTPGCAASKDWLLTSLSNVRACFTLETWRSSD